MDIPLIGHISRPDKRHFAPDQDPAAVALVVKARMMRITGSPDGIGAHLGNQIQILFDLVLFQRDPHRRPVFVMHHAVNPIRTAVQQESLLRIDAEKAQSERHRNLVAHASLVGQLHAHGIHIRIFDAIPQRRISYDHRYGRRSILTFAPCTTTVSRFGVSTARLTVRVLPAAPRTLTTVSRSAFSRETSFWWT